MSIVGGIVGGSLRYSIVWSFSYILYSTILCVLELGLLPSSE
jgi:hypothetical protein